MQCLFPKTLNPQLFVRSFKSTPQRSSKGFTARAMSSGPRMFQLKVDPLTGNSEWVIIDEDEASGDDVPGLATTSYLDMLNDTPRNKAYREAIDKTITKPCHVLDIGAGTGLLSMMAARALGHGDAAVSSSSRGMVTACESYLPMVKLMRKVLHANGMQRKIRIINKRSDELQVGMDMPSRADVLVSEILDSELLGEGLIPTLQHAHDKLLADNPKTVPYLATIYGQLVESTDLWKLHDLFNNEKGVEDEIRLVPEGMDTALCIKHQQFSMHCDALKEDMKLLSEPFKVFTFDFWRRPESHREIKLSVRATGAGTVHAIISWWLLQLDDEGTVFYSTAPKWISCPSSVEQPSSSNSCSQNWCDHWKQCVWFIPNKGLSVSKDEEVNLLAIHTETSISYEVKVLSPKLKFGQCELSTQKYQINLPPEKIALYSDVSWRCLMLKAIKNALECSLQLKQKKPSFCVVVDDSIFMTVGLAHLAKASHVLSLFPGLQEKGAQYLRAIATSNGYSEDHVQVLKINELLTSQRKIDLLVGEPFYYGNNRVLPWQNLRFW